MHLLHKEELTAAVAAWRSRAEQGPLRFPIGAPVECRVSDLGFVAGKVLKHNHREPGVGVMPYQVLVDSEHQRGEQNAVWAPADIDECIRALLRFRVGEHVECCVNPDLGLWAGGKVVSHFFRERRWPEGKYAPYQVQIESFFDEESGKTLNGALIWAPEDSDRCIRKGKTASGQ